MLKLSKWTILNKKYELILNLMTAPYLKKKAEKVNVTKKKQLWEHFTAN